MPANPIRGEVDVTIGTRTITLRPTHDAMVAVEKETGESMSRLVRRAAERDLGIQHIDAVIRHGAMAAAEKVTEVEIKDATKRGFLRQIGAVSEWLVNAATGGVSVEDAEKNPEAPAVDQPAS